MAKQKQQPKPKTTSINADIAGAGIVSEMPITDTLRENYMPYAMSVIVSRALPEIDGFKPSHRKLLYTMYKMGLLKGARTKSANIVGQTMRLNPHGDAAIYETMVRLSRGNQTLLYPFVDSKGNFGKAYSRDMSYAASRYTEAKLDPICAYVFGDIDKDTVDFVDNYDSTTKEPTLLPVAFPSILTNSNLGIAVGMACSICSFHLQDITAAAIHLMDDENYDIFSDLQAPDFPGGGIYLFDEEEMRRVINTGRGSLKIRAKWRFDTKDKCIEITEIPPTTTVEAIMDRIVELVRQKKITELKDMRDETDRDGLKLTLDVKQGVDADALMAKLFKLTPLQDNFACNFNVLIVGSPRVLGAKDLLCEWLYFRRDSVKRRTYFDLNRLKEKIHLLKGLQKILLDIDKAVQIVRQTEEEQEVVPNLMIGFGIDQTQAEYVAEIKLRHLNREYILKRTEELTDLIDQAAQLEDVLQHPKKIDKIIAKELREIAKKFDQPRRTQILYDVPEEYKEEAPQVEHGEVHLFFTKEGYFKKITPQSWRMGNTHKLKPGDEVAQYVVGDLADDMLIFTSACQVYKAKVSAFANCKASDMGYFLPTELQMEEGERPLYMAVTGDYTGFMLFVFQNGKAAKVPMSAYYTKTNRKKLLRAFSDINPTAGMFYFAQEQEVALRTAADKLLIFNTALLQPKTTKSTQGVAVMRLGKRDMLVQVCLPTQLELADTHRYRCRSLPAAGAKLTKADTAEQLTLQ